jgi:heat-inducible transcriptional repressor
MLDERKTAILRAVVHEYIETAQPVGSGHVARAPGVGVSAATVRNEMAVLEQEGYLHQPHTSAGRVPTDKGYRFFVDHLTRPGRLDTARQQRVRDFFETGHGAIEQMLHETSTLLAGLTDYAAVVTGPSQEAATVRSIQVVGLSPRAAMVVAVLSNAAVESEQIELDEDMTDGRLNAASAHLMAHVAGSTLGRAERLTSTGDAVVDRICTAALEQLRAGAAHDEEALFVGGASRMANAFDAVEVVRRVLTALEQQYVVVSLLRDVLDRGLSVAIGAEHGVEPLVTCSIVVAPYAVEGEMVGTIGVLGPTRMNYPQALAAVDLVSDRLGERLSDG